MPRKTIPYSERKFDKANKNQYDQEYRKQNLDRIEIIAPKGTKERIKEKAAQEGVTMSEWIKTVIDNALKM